MKLKLTWLMTLFMAFVMQFSYAQEKTVTGTVTSSDDGMPLPGVSVVVKGTTRGTQTDFDGGYSLRASQGEVLVFSSIGMKTSEITVGASNTYNVSMNSDVAALDEVVVVAYGIQKKEALTGSVGEVKSEAISKITTGNVTQGLVGKVAGVQVFNNNGMPGDAPIIRFRGIGSINASAAPLYVVDGVPFNGDPASINSQDIESMSFLKDAAAAALYGNRGANGVIIITTKKGKNNKTVVTIDTRSGFAVRAVPEYDIMRGAGEYYEGYFQALKNGYTFGPLGLDSAAAGQLAANNLINGDQGLGYNAYNVPNNQLIDPVTGRLNPSARLNYNEDWNDYLFGNNFFTQSYINISGGSDTTSHFFSAGYERNDGYVVNSGLEKLTTRMKTDSQISESIKIGGSVSYTHILQDYLDGYTGGNTYSSPFFWTRNIAPIYPVNLYDAAGNPIYGPNGRPMFDDGTGVGGSPVRPFGALQHPYATAINDVKQWRTDNLYASAFAEIKIMEGLKFTYTVTGDLFAQADRSLDTPLYGDAVNAGGRVSYSSSRSMAFTQQQLLHYSKSFGNHNLDVLLGHETLDRRGDAVGAGRSNLLLPDSPYVNQAAVMQSATGSGSSYALEGFFSRVTYDYDNKYYLNASIRRDGSSRFHPDNRWGTFYGLGAAWRVSQEAFLNDVSWLDELKLKASYGEQGNDNLGIELPYLNQYSVVSTTDSSLPISFTLVALGNPDITWETTANFNAGFDLSLFNRRLNIEAEYFERRINDMLFQRPLPVSSGFASIPENIGDMNNKGYELTISADLIRTNDFTLTLHGNATHYKNEITELPFNGRENNNIPTGNFIREEGGSVYDFYMREFAGVNPVSGAALWWMDDPNNDGQRIVTENYADADLYRIGKSAIPDVYGGFGTMIKYKNIDLAVDFAYQFGGYSYDGIWMSGLGVDPGQNFHRDFNNTWTIDNQTATLPRADVQDPNNHFSGSSLGLVKSDYLSIQNISLGYTFNSKIAESIGFNSLRFYGLVDNVHLWSKRKGFDPRLGGVTGASDNKYGMLRTMSLGVNIQF